MEQWRAVPGYEGLYEVSSLGRVRSLPRRTTSGRVLKAQLGKRGYLAVSLHDRGQRIRAVHHLVAEAFLGPRPPGAEVRHLDGHKTHNLASNLAYGTKRENALDAVAHGQNPMTRKTHCPQGHPYFGDNLGFDKNTNARWCRECRRIRNRKKPKEAE